MQACGVSSCSGKSSCAILVHCGDPDRSSVSKTPSQDGSAAVKRVDKVGEVGGSPLGRDCSCPGGCGESLDPRGW